MKIKILDISDSLVRFRSESGEGYAKWSGEKPLPNHNYDVELDINDEFIWGQNITTIDATSTSMRGDNYKISAVAEVISYEEDGCLSVKLNESVILLEVEGAPDNVSGYVKLDAKDVTLFPVNL
jgi:hypothetical protein